MIIEVSMQFDTIQAQTNIQQKYKDHLLASLRLSVAYTPWNVNTGGIASGLDLVFAKAKAPRFHEDRGALFSYSEQPAHIRA